MPRTKALVPRLDSGVIEDREPSRGPLPTAESRLQGSRRTTGRWPVMVLGGLILLVYCGLRANLLDIPLDRDEGAYGYIAQRILDGDVPFVDVIDHKPPVVFWIYVLRELVLPPTPVGVHLFLHLYNLVTLVVMFLTARAMWGLAAGGWTALTFAVFSADPELQGFTASTEMFLLLPLCLGLLAAVSTMSRTRPGALLPALSGAGAALACWTKPTAAPIALCLGLIVIVAGLVGAPAAAGGWRRALGAGAAWLAGGVAVSATIFVAFLVRGAADEMVYWAFVHNFRYSQEMPFSQAGSELLERAIAIAAGNPVVLGLAAIAVPLCVRRRLRGGWLLAGLLVASVVAVLPGHAYRHYFAQAVPAVALAAGAAAAGLVGLLPATRALRVMVGAVLATMVVGVPLVVHSGVYLLDSPSEISRRYFGYNPFPESLELAEYLRERTTSEDTLYIFGSEPQIPFYARRRAASALTMVYPATRRSYPDYLELQRSEWRLIEAANPAYIVLVDLPASVNWDGQAELWLRQRVVESLRESYRLDAVVVFAPGRVGRVVEATDPARLREVVGSERPPISVFRRFD